MTSRCDITKRESRVASIFKIRKNKLGDILLLCNPSLFSTFPLFFHSHICFHWKYSVLSCVSCWCVYSGSLRTFEAMEESVSFSVLNQRLRPQLTAMERLCYPLEDQPHTSDSIRCSPTTRPTMLTHLEPQVNESLTVTQEEDNPEQEEEEQEEVDSDGSTPRDVCAESLTVAGDCWPCPKIECLELNDSTTVTDCRVPTLRSEERRVGKECRSRWWTEH